MATKKIQPANPTVTTADAKKNDAAEQAKTADRTTASVRFGRKTNGASGRF